MIYELLATKAANLKLIKKFKKFNKAVTKI